MGIAVALVALVILAIIGIIAFSVFGSAFDSFFDKVNEASKTANEQSDPNPEDVGGNVVTGDRLCNLKVEFVGGAEGKLLDNDIRLFHGDFKQFRPLSDPFGDEQNYDNRVIIYKWFCPQEGPEQASFLDFLSFYGEDSLSKAGTFVANNLSETGERVKLRFFIDGQATNGSRELTGLQNPDSTKRVFEFSDSIDIDAGVKFPFAYNVKLFIYDIIEDDYDVNWWNEDFESNDRPLGFKFDHRICKAGNFPC